MLDEKARQPTRLRRARDGACRRSSASAYHGADGVGHFWEASLPEKRAVLSEGCGVRLRFPGDAIIIIPSRMFAMRLKKLAPLFLCLSATLFSARFSIEHIGRIVRLADPQIAPDGKSIALVVSRTNYEEDRYDPELVLIDVATHNQRTLTRDRRGVSQARWSPDGSRLAFLATVDTRTQIFVLPMTGGALAVGGDQPNVG